MSSLTCFVCLVKTATDPPRARVRVAVHPGPPRGLLKARNWHVGPTGSGAATGAARCVALLFISLFRGPNHPHPILLHLCTANEKYDSSLQTILWSSIQLSLYIKVVFSSENFWILVL